MHSRPFFECHSASAEDRFLSSIFLWCLLPCFLGDAPFQTTAIAWPFDIVLRHELVQGPHWTLVTTFALRTGHCANW
jgi:hypothetical protein